MRDLEKLILCGLAVCLTSAGMAEAQRGAGNGKGQGQCVWCNTAPAELGSAEAATLRYMYEEEKSARDFYGEMYAKWSLQTFASIQSAEVRHFSALGTALARHGIDASDITAKPAGEFVSATIQSHYNELIEKGSRSFVGALNAAGLLEEIDIADLKAAIAETTAPDLKQIYANLLSGSENHLRAAARQVAFNGGTYAAQYLSSEEVAQILSAPNSSRKGKGAAKGNGQRGKQQNGKNGNGRRCGR